MQASGGPPSCLSAPLQSIAAVARRSDSPLAPDTAFGKPNTASSHERHRLPLVASEEATIRAPKRGTGGSTHRASIDPTEVGPTGRTARRARDSPKRIQLCSPRSTRSLQAASVATQSTHVPKSRQPKPRDQAHEAPLCASTTITRARRIRSPLVQHDPALSHRRGNATGASRHTAEAAHRAIRRSSASSVTVVRAHPSRSTHTSEDSAPRLAADCTPSNTRGVRSASRFDRRSSRYVAAVLAPLSLRLGGPRPQRRTLPSARAGSRTRRATSTTRSAFARRQTLTTLEPIGRSQTTSPMGFVAFRRNEHQ